MILLLSLHAYAATFTPTPLVVNSANQLSGSTGSMAWADLDNDGKIEFLWDSRVTDELVLLVLTYDPATAIWTKYPSQPSRVGELGENAALRGVHPADFDNDGDIDVVTIHLANSLTDTALIEYHEMEDGVFLAGVSLTGCNVGGVANVEGSSTVDIDGDSFLDIVYGTSTDLCVFSQIGLDTRAAVSQGIVTIDSDNHTITDVDRDGYPDLFQRERVSPSSSIAFYPGTTSGFASTTPEGSTFLGQNSDKTGVAMCDLDGTGFIGAFSVNSGEDGLVHFVDLPAADLTGSTFFNFYTGLGSEAGPIACADVDMNGVDEFIVGDASQEKLGFMAFTPGVTELESEEYVSPNRRARALSLADLDLDGDLDFVTSGNGDGETTILWNDDTFTSNLLPIQPLLAVYGRDGVTGAPAWRIDYGSQLQVHWTSAGGDVYNSAIRETSGGRGASGIPHPTHYFYLPIDPIEESVSLDWFHGYGTSATTSSIPIPNTLIRTDPSDVANRGPLLIGDLDWDLDGVPNELEGVELINGVWTYTDIDQLDPDGDGIPAPWDPMSTGNTPDSELIAIAVDLIWDNPTDVPDSDSDGVHDWLDLDDDNDGLLDTDEAIQKTDPLLADTDSDGLDDFDELNEHFTDPLTADIDADGLEDGTEIAIGTDPFNPDSDRDNLTDGYEIETSETNPNAADSDADGLNDDIELAAGTDPNDRDTDGDGCGDDIDAAPLDPNTGCPNTYTNPTDTTKPTEPKPTIPQPTGNTNTEPNTNTSATNDTATPAFQETGCHCEQSSPTGGVLPLFLLLLARQRRSRA